MWKQGWRREPGIGARGEREAGRGGGLPRRGRHGGDVNIWVESEGLSTHMNVTDGRRTGGRRPGEAEEGTDGGDGRRDGGGVGCRGCGAGDGAHRPARNSAHATPSSSALWASIGPATQSPIAYTPCRPPPIVTGVGAPPPSRPPKSYRRILVGALIEYHRIIVIASSSIIASSSAPSSSSPPSCSHDLHHNHPHRRRHVAMISTIIILPPLPSSLVLVLRHAPPASAAPRRAVPCRPSARLRAQRAGARVTL